MERIINISQLSVKNSADDSGEGASGRYSINFKAYWQPETTGEQVKAGLESREFSQPAFTVPLIPAASPPVNPSTKP